MNYSKYITGICAIIMGWFLPLYASAVELLPACASGTGFGNCSTCDFIELFVNASELILQFVGIAVLITIIIGGFMWILSAGNPNLVQKGQAIIVGSVIGVLIVLGSYFIINAVIAGFVGDNDFEDVQLFGGTNWDTYCARSASNPGTEPTSSCSGQPNGSACETSTCTENCQCLNESCVSECALLYSTQQTSCVVDESACSGSNGGDGLCPATQPFCCLQGETVNDTDITPTPEELAEDECLGEQLGTSCQTDTCTTGCACNSDQQCVSMCEGYNDTDTTADCLSEDECTQVGGTNAGSEEVGCTASTICCVIE